MCIRDRHYTMPETIGDTVNTNYNEFWPYIDPDERFLIFISNRPGGYGMHDLYLSSRNQDGTWNDPINLGPEINSNLEDSAPYISPDGLYFFFNAWKTGDLGYNPYWVDAQVIYNLITDVEDEDSNPVDFYLSQNYPNPFNPTTKIKYTLPKASKVKIEIYNLLGQKIKTILNKPMPAGSHEVEFTANNLPSGVYLYSIEAGEFQQVKKMVLLK